MESGEGRKFTIAGNDYDVPSVGSFNMGEAQTLYDYSKLTIEDFAPDEDGAISDERAEELTEKMKNPGFLRTLLHVAYKRGSNASDARARAVIESENFAERYVEWLEWLMQEDEASPPDEESTSELDESSPRSSDDSSTSSGSNGSDTSSDARAATPAPTGVLSLATSSPESPPIESAS